MTSAKPAASHWAALSPAETLARLAAPGSPFEMQEIEIGGIRQRVWKHAPPTLREVFDRGRTFGDAEFMVYEDERVTFEGFSRAATSLARALIDRGLAPGDRVVIAMRNLPEWPVAFFATILAGGIATLLNGWWTAPELAYGLADSGAKIAVLDAERHERLHNHLEGCEHVIVSRAADLPSPGESRVIALEALIGVSAAWSGLADRPIPDIACAPDDDATILYTSGTTGKPKGAVGSHRNAVSTLMAATYSPARAMLRRGEAPPAPGEPQPQKIILIAIPLFHTTGCHTMLLPALFNGIKMVMMHRWNCEKALGLIERERVTNIGGVPTVAWQVLEHEARANYDLSSLRAVTYGGAPAAAELSRRIVSTWPHAVGGLGWGMTETCGTFTSNLAEDYEERPESSGPALPVCDMKIVDESGRTLPPGGVGELWAKGPNVVRGYWMKPEATADTFIDGWLKTGDLARIDEDGFLYILDRKKDMVIRGGENIYCIEVENALYDHPAVMDAAVIGIAHRTLGEEPAAVVTLTPGRTVCASDLQAFLARRIAAFKVPVKILVHAECLPRNANGKIMKNELKKLFA